jgi:PKD repeat protein
LAGGVYTVTLVVNDGKVDSMPSTTNASIIEVNDAPVANAGADKTAFVNELVTFDGSASYDIDGNITSYEWDFGDGTTGNGVTTSHIYSTPGTYTVTLTVTDNNGAKASDTATVNVQPVFQASITKHSVSARWNKGQKLGYAEVQISFLVNNGSSNKITIKEVTDELGVWNLQSSQVTLKINGASRTIGVTLDANSDATIDLGANGITLNAGDVVEITKLKLTNNQQGSHSLTSQILNNGYISASNTVNFTI